MAAFTKKVGIVPPPPQKKVGITTIYQTQWIGLRENLNRKPSIFPLRSWGFPVNFPLNQSIDKLLGDFNPSEKYEFVSWDCDIPNICKKYIKHVPNHSPAKCKWVKRCVSPT